MYLYISLILTVKNVQDFIGDGNESAESGEDQSPRGDRNESSQNDSGESFESDEEAHEILGKEKTVRLLLGYHM